MAGDSSIEWTELTWNPVTGCTKISAGCKNCYAERMAKRLQAMGVMQYRRGFKVRLAPQTLTAPYSWKSPKLVFVNSMSDLFHEAVPFDYIRKVFSIMQETPRHTYQILTKRAERLTQLAGALPWPENVWIGVTVENEQVAYRLDLLKKVPAQVKFVSFEPLIGEVISLKLKGIDWVIVGGESGPFARPISKDWIERIHNACRKHGIPFFFKQWGAARFNANVADPTIHKSDANYAKGGCQLNGTVYREMPEAV